jgi:hypothetical protein
MLPALVLASWWAQAEPAPVEPTPPPPAPAPLPLPDNRLDITAGYGRRLGDAAATVGPRSGFGLSAGYTRRLVPLPHDFDVTAGLEFAYDKFATRVSTTVLAPSGEIQTMADDRVLSEASFAATGGLSWGWRRVRPFAQLGVGVSLAYFSSPEMALSPGHLTAAQPLVRGAGGLAIAITPEIAVTIRLAYTHLLTHPTVNSTTPSFLGDLLDAGAGVALGF